MPRAATSAMAETLVLDVDGVDSTRPKSCAKRWIGMIFFLSVTAVGSLLVFVTSIFWLVSIAINLAFYGILIGLAYLGLKRLDLTFNTFMVMISWGCIATVLYVASFIVFELLKFLNSLPGDVIMRVVLFVCIQGTVVLATYLSGRGRGGWFADGSVGLAIKLTGGWPWETKQVTQWTRNIWFMSVCFWALWAGYHAATMKNFVPLQDTSSNLISWENAALIAYVVTGMGEELLKFVVIRSFPVFNKWNSSPEFGPLIGACIGLAFAYVENWKYLYSIFSADVFKWELIVARFTLCNMLHVACGTFTGFGVSYLSLDSANSILYPFLGWCMAVAVHGTYNLFAFRDMIVPCVAISISSFGLSIAAMIWRIKSHTSKLDRRTVTANTFES